MLAQGHAVNLFLLQEAVRLCTPGSKYTSSMDLQELIAKNPKKILVNILNGDAEMRGIPMPISDGASKEGSYESLVDLIEFSDRVIGIL